VKESVAGIVKMKYEVLSCGEELFICCVLQWPRRFDVSGVANGELRALWLEHSRYLLETRYAYGYAAGQVTFPRGKPHVSDAGSLMDSSYSPVVPVWKVEACAGCPAGLVNWTTTVGRRCNDH
jgi:hypothetical protein